jgi:hypothetical protein
MYGPMYSRVALCTLSCLGNGWLAYGWHHTTGHGVGGVDAKPYGLIDNIVSMMMLRPLCAGGQRICNASLPPGTQQHHVSAAHCTFYVLRDY